MQELKDLAPSSLIFATFPGIRGREQTGKGAQDNLPLFLKLLCSVQTSPVTLDVVPLSPNQLFDTTGDHFRQDEHLDKETENSGGGCGFLAFLQPLAGDSTSD